MSTNPAPPLRNLTIEQAAASDGTPTLVCRGRLTLETSAALKSEVKALAPQHKLLLADMSGVNFVDSAGLGALLGIYVSAKSDGCHLELTNPHPHLRDLLNMTKLSQVFQDKP